MAETDRVERVREDVRKALRAGLVGDLMRLTGLSDGAIYQFTQEGSTTRPYVRTLARYEQALSTLRHSSEGAPPLPGNGPPRADGATIEISRDDAFYYRGVLDAELRTLGSVTQQLGAIGETLQAVRGLLDGAIGGVRGVAQSGLLPAPGSADLPSMPVTRLPEPEEATQRKKRTG